MILNNIKRLINTFRPKEIKLFKSDYFVQAIPISNEKMEILIDIINEHKQKNNPLIYSNGNDKRWFNLKKQDPLFFDEIIKDSGIANYIKKEYDKLFYFVMYNEINYAPNNLGSGDGMHFDSTYFQRKLIYYLSDVNTNNGPFIYYYETYNLKFIRKYLIENIWSKNLLRVNENYIENLNKKEVTGKKGEGFYIATSSIHGGKPLEIGERKAITFYLFEEKKLPKKFKKFI